MRVWHCPKDPHLTRGSVEAVQFVLIEIVGMDDEVDPMAPDPRPIHDERGIGNHLVDVMAPTDGLQW